MSNPKPAAVQLREARDKLYEAILPHIAAYEAETGLFISEIAIERPFTMIGKDVAPVMGLKVRTNANSI